MLYWETANQNPSLDYSTLEFAAIWRALPKVVFSTTLSAVQGNARLASGGLEEEIEHLRAEAAEGDIAIGGGRSPPRRPRWVSSTSIGSGSCRCWWAVAVPSFLNARTA